MMKIMIESGRNFARVKTAEPSELMQICNLIRALIRQLEKQ